MTFHRTGDRRYGVLVTSPTGERLCADPAPGYDPDVPHDLVHYVVEAELGLVGGVFGRAAAGGGSFVASGADQRDQRDQRRAQRRRAQREERLRRDDHAGRRDMARSEHLAGICDVAWKLRHGRRREAPDWARPEQLSQEEHAHLERVLARLDGIAPLWRRLPVGGSIRFTWPAVEPSLVPGGRQLDESRPPHPSI